MKKFITYATILFLFFPIKADDGLQLFGSRKANEKEQSSSDLNKQRNEPTEDFSSSEVSSRKNIESVIPVKRIPGGWVFRDELLAPW